MDKKGDLRESDVMVFTDKELALALKFAVMVPTDPDSIMVIKECCRRLSE